MSFEQMFRLTIQLIVDVYPDRQDDMIFLYMEKVFMDLHVSFPVMKAILKSMNISKLPSRYICKECNLDIVDNPQYTICRICNAIVHNSCLKKLVYCSNCCPNVEI